MIFKIFLWFPRLFLCGRHRKGKAADGAADGATAATALAGTRVDATRAAATSERERNEPAPQA